MARDIQIDITSNPTKAVEGVNKTAAAIEGLKNTLAGITRVMGIIGLISSVIALFRRFSAAAKRTADELASLGKSALQATREAEALHTTVSGLEAIRLAATDAGVEADALNEILNKYKSHQITFEELATAIGSTSAAIAQLEGEIAPGRAGRDYLAGLAGAAERKQEMETERKGLRAATWVIKRTGGGDNSPEANAAWDTLMRAAGGNTDRATELYDQYKSRRNLSSIGVMGFATGMSQLPAAAGRYQAGMQQEAEQRAAARAAHDAEVARLRQAKSDADELAKSQAEAKAAAVAADRAKQDAARAEEQMEARRVKAHTDWVNREAEADEARRQAAATAAADSARVRDDTQAKIAAITVDAPRAASALGASGGIMGGSMNNISRLQQQRQQHDAKILAYHREEVELLAEIKAQLIE